MRGSLVMSVLLTPIIRDTTGNVSNPSSVLTLHVGQVIKASTLSGTPNGRIGGNAVIRIGNESLQVRSQLKLMAGDRLTLRVTGLHPRTWLSVVSINDTSPVGPPNPTFKPYLLQLQPRQGGWPILFTALNTLLKNQTVSTLPPAIKQLSEVLLRGISSRSEITQTAALRHTLLNSGLFLEAKLGDLLKGKNAPLEGDLKGLILTLLNRLNSQPNRLNDLRRSILLPDQQQAPRPPNRDSQPEPQARSHPLDPALMEQACVLETLRRVGEAALARIALHQITAAEHAMDGNACWMVEVPVRQGQDSDIVHLRIARENRDKRREQSPRWSVTLALDLPELGPLHIQITLGNTQISGVFWAEKRQTGKILQTEFARLHQALENQGLQVVKLACGEGVPPSPLHDRPPRSLINAQV
jgi:hypothetical protein